MILPTREKSGLKLEKQNRKKRSFLVGNHKIKGLIFFSEACLTNIHRYITLVLRIRDPVHNFIVLPDYLLPLVNARVLQRLRRIRQLAFADLVYPGALHTRFDHTLGVAHVAGLMAEHLVLNSEERRVVLLAALLHDVGHGPFSHVSESSLDRFANRSDLSEEQKKDKIHEVITAEIIRGDAELSKILDDESRESVIQLLKDGFGRPVLKQIVSGPLDSDKQDYLLRDSHCCGVRYGIFDMQQLHRTLSCPKEGEGFDEEGLLIKGDVHAVEQFVLAKYYMTANVYRHRVRLVTDQMIGRAIQLGIEIDRIEEMDKLFRFEKTADFIQNYQSWDDARFLETFGPLWKDPPGAKSGAVLRRLRERNLLKRVFTERIESYNPPRVREVLKDLASPKSDPIRKEIEREAAAFLSKELGEEVDPDLVIAYAFSIKSVRESSKNDESDILIMDGPTPKAFTEESTLFKSINEAYSDRHVEIYAPIRWPSPEKKEKLRMSWKDVFHEILERHGKAKPK